MSATERLRELLDERGVEHYDGTESTLWGYEDYNEFTGVYRFSADETSDGYMQVRLWHATPEQAIAATLGGGECDQLRAENAKLRELVLLLFECATGGCCCEKCRENNDGYACAYIMRELGIEVDDA